MQENNFDFAPIINIPNNIYATIVIIFMVLNLIMFLLFRKKIKNAFFHKIISLINFIIEIIIFVIGFYKGHPLFITFVPFVVGFMTVLGYGLTTELSDEDKSMTVVIHRIPVLTDGGIRMKARFLELIFFPGYYLIKSWKK